MRAHLTALERQRVLEQAQPETVDLEEQAAGVTETVLDVVLDETADTAVAETGAGCRGLAGRYYGKAS